MAINYPEGFKRIRQVIGSFWLGIIFVGILLLALLLLVINIAAIMINSGVTPLPQTIAAFSVLILLGIAGYIIILKSSKTIFWIIKGFTD